MVQADILSLLGATDIYLVDQIMKGRYRADDVLLDAGCGGGRNLQWFLRNDFRIYGVDSNADAIQGLQKEHPSLPPNRFQVCPVEKMPFEPGFFDGIICSAVLHFAHNTQHFLAMMCELYRVLKPGGSLFIRTASDIGIETRVQLVGDGVYHIPDGSTRFLLTRKVLQQLLEHFPFYFLDEFKTVNVNDQRSMSTLMLQRPG
jgi:SAM-dependent methyltransferase